MTERAIRKINEEMQKDPSDAYAEAIGHYVIDRAVGDELDAKRVLQDGKSLKGCLDDVKRKAKALAKNGVAMVRDDVVFGWVDVYFGFGSGGYSAAATTGPSKSLDVDLSDFL